MNGLKRRRVAGCAAALLMIIAALCAVSGEGFRAGSFVLALLLSLAAGAVIAADVKLPPYVSIVVLFVLPAAALMCMEFFTHVPWDLKPPVFLLNYLFFLIIYLVFSAIAGNARWGGLISPIFFALAGTVNYFVVSFRSAPIVPWDIFSIKTAASVAESYNIEMSWRLYFVLAGFVWLMILGEKMRVPIKRLRLRLISCGVSLAMLAGFVGYVQTKSCEDLFGLDNILFTPNVLYRNNGFMVGYLANLQYLHIEKPQGYSADAAGEIAETYDSSKESGDGSVSAANDLPNILVIMNEAFSDLSVYGDFGVTEAYLPFFNSLKENTVRGNLYVSVKGGNTANTEFEFLTGNTMAFLPTGSIPYQQFISADMPSLASQLGKMGYRTAALHPYFSTGWNRDRVYRYLGFDRQYFRDTGDFPQASLLRGWVDDASAFDKLEELYEEKEKGTPLFAFEVTMQNHGGYSKEYDDLTNEIQLAGVSDDTRRIHHVQIEAAEKYLTLLKKTDEAFEDLIGYFENQQEKTIILMFGDHQPSEYISNVILNVLGIDTGTRNDAVEDMAKSYEVPFLLWANYDIEEREGVELSANYLGNLLLKTAGVPLSGYRSFLEELSDRYPIVTANFYRDSGGRFVQWSDEREKSPLKDYAVLQYNNLVDDKKRTEGFFD